jgi:Tfp pilus assembly protein PilX
MRDHRFTKKRSSEAGFSLILALLTLLLISAIATGLALMSSSETAVSANFRDEQTAFFGAKGGIEEVRDRFRAAAPNSLAANLPTVVPGNTNGVVYVTNPLVGEVVAPWNTTGANYPDTEICKEVACNAAGVPAGAPWYTAVPASAAYAAAPQLPWKWTRITLKTNGSTAPNYINGNNAPATLNNMICWNGSNEYVLPVGVANCQAATPSTLPVFLVTTYAMTPSGTHRMVQSELTLVTFPPLPGALTFAGPGAVYGSTNSNPFHIDGTDTASPACAPAGNKPAIASYDPASAAALTGDLARPDHYTGYPPGSPVSVAPSVSNTGPSAVPPANTMGPLATVTGLQNLVNAVTSIADQVVPPPGGTPTSLGTAANPLVNVVQGDVSLASVHGYGILLVEGNANFTGNTSWDGVILVIGTGSLTVSGGGGGQINGGVLVANINTGVVGNTPGPPTVDWSGGGGNGIYYNSCDANSLFNNRTGYFRTVATREMMF